MNSTTNARDRRGWTPPRGVRVAAGAIVLVILVAAAYLYNVVDKLPLDSERQGDSLRITRDDGSDILVTLVLAERRQTLLESYRERLDVNAPTHGLDLVVHDAANAQPQWTRVLVEREDRSALSNYGRLLGYDDRHLWLFTTRLEALDLRTRETVAAAVLLTKANPDLAGALPAEARHLRFDATTRQLGFIALDGREYRVDPETLRAVPYVPVTAAAPRDMDEWHKQWRAARLAATAREHYPHDFWYRGLTLDGRRWLGLFTAEEAARERPGAWWSPLLKVHGETARRRFFLVHLNVQDDGDAKIAAIDLLPGQSRDWLQGSLLREADAARVLRLRDPDSVLIVHRERIGADGTLHLSRVGIDGKPLWTADTGLVRTTQVFPGAGHVLFTGAPPEPPGRQLAAEQLVSVATSDGSIARDDALLED